MTNAIFPLYVLSFVYFSFVYFCYFCDFLYLFNIDEKKKLILLYLKIASLLLYIFSLNIFLNCVFRKIK